jgi:hypothetical protein
VTNQTTDPEIDQLVPRQQVRAECGGISRMTEHRWDHDPRMAELGWPPPIKVGQQVFRSRRQLELFKQNLIRRAAEHRRKLVPEPA